MRTVIAEIAKHVSLRAASAVTRRAAVVARFVRGAASVGFGLGLALLASTAEAHTVSYGYVAGTQPGTYTFWYGTYHSTGTANYNEGSLRLTCGGGFSSTTAFNQRVTTRPSGLVTGTNYFYDAGYGGEPGSPLYVATATHTSGSLSGPVLVWQGVTFTNITIPGTCTFTYIPIASPTQVWDPNGALGNLVGVGGGTFVLTEGITIAKTSPTTSYATVGQIINYSYAVQNTGNMVLTAPLTVADNKTTVTCPAFSPLAGTSPVINGLATGATITCTSSYTITQADIDFGSLTNTATATSGTSTTPYTSPVASLKINAAQAPAMLVVKTSTTADFALPNVSIPYSYKVSNSGNTTITAAITITDNKIPTVTCPALPAAGLAPGAFITCTGTYLTTQADIDAGGVTNAAFSKSGTTVSPTVNLLVPAVNTRALTLVKATTATGFSVLGASIPYTYVVTNAGNTTLLTALTVSDDKIPSVTCPPLPVGGLVPNASQTCTGLYTVTQADLNAGTLTNTASAASGTTVSPSKSITLTGTKTPAMTVTKDTLVATFSAPGVSIPYTFVVRNTGNITLTAAISVADTRIGTVTCPALPAGGLIPLASITCTGSYTTTQGDVNAGSVVNAATASTTLPVIGLVTSPTDTHTLPATQTRALSVVKSGAPATFTVPNTTITYSYVVRNTGNVTIVLPTVVSIADDKLGSIACPVLPALGLAPNATLTCQKTYLTTQADVDAGSITNSASASDGIVVSPSVTFTVTANQTNALAVTKDTVPVVTSYSAANQILNYRFVVTNTGNTTATSAITVTDTKIASVVCDPLPVGGLPPAGTLVCLGAYTVTQADVDAGRVDNSAFAKSGTTTSTPPVTHSTPAAQTRQLGLLKTSSSGPFTAPGVSLTYSYKVTNLGNVTVTAPISVTDDRIATVTCPALPAGGLLPAGFITCSATYVTTQADVNAGGVTNIATAASGTTVSDPGTTTVAATRTPGMTVLKTAAPATFSTVGATITYNYRVSNTGNTTLVSAITVGDNKIPSVSCPALPPLGLAPAAFIDCTGLYTITQVDIDAGSVANTASATSGLTTSPPVNISITANKLPALTVVKTASVGGFATAGVSITYSYQVTNAGNTTLTSALSILDNKISGVGCPSIASGLAPGASVICTAPYLTTQADVDFGGITNTASAKSGTTISPTVTLTVTAARTPALSVVKSTTALTYTTVGQTVPYQFRVTNAGNTTLTTAVSITDPKIAAVACPSVGAGLVPGGFIDCTATYTVVQADLDAGNIVNTAFATSGTVMSPTTGTTLTGTQTPKLSIVKTANKASVATLNEVIGYSYLVTNTGNVTLTAPVVITDNRIASVSCPATVLAAAPGPGNSLTCTANYTVTQADLDAGNIVNTASGASATASGPVVSPVTSLTVPAVKSPALSVTKATVAPLPALNAVGQIVNYSFVVTNTGNTTITTPVTISDSKIAVVTCGALPGGGLAPSPAANSTLTCTGSYALTQADLDAGTVANTATSTSGPTVSTPPVTHTQPLAQIRTLSIVKTPSQATFAVAGTVVTYSYAVRNTGNITIPAASSVSITDTKIATVTCPAIPPSGLAPNAVLTCSAVYTTTQADLDSGGVTNGATATVPGYPTVNTTATVTASKAAALLVVKTSTQSLFASVGQTINYRFMVTNSGNTTITQPITVSDTKIGAVACPPLGAGLAPGFSIPCDANYTITQADLDAGFVTNLASATSGLTTSPTVTHTLPGSQTRALTTLKTALPTTFSAPNVTINYTYVVRNTGNTTIPSSAPITVSDNRLATVLCDPMPALGLAPNATLTCRASYLTKQSDVDVGSINNTASATDGVVTSPPTTISVNAIQSPAVTVDKATLETDFDTVGQIMNYRFTVTNTGNVTQTALPVVVDDRIPLVSCPPLPASGLLPGNFTVCNGTYTITQADIDAGSVRNTAYVKTGPTTSTPPTTHTLPGVKKPKLSLVKSANVSGFSALNAPIQYAYVVTNIGNVTLTASITVADDKIVTVSCPALPPAGLAPTKSITCNATYLVTQADLDAGTLKNTAVATSGAITSPATSVTLGGTKLPNLRIVKTSPVTSFSAVGTVIPYAYTVSNIGNVTLTSAITVADNKITTVTCPALPAGGLLPGGFITCTGNYTVAQIDLDLGSIANTASATSGGVTSAPVTLTITGIKLPGMAVLKSTTATTFTAVGNVLPFTYRVTNTGNVTITVAITVTDNKIPGVVCPALPGTGLAPGAFIQCTGAYTVTQADLDLGSVSNSAFATSGPVVSPPVVVTVTATQSPGVSVVKTANTPNITRVGQIIAYSYRVTNTGNVSLLTPVSVVDDKIPTVACPALPATGLRPLGFVDCTANYTVTQADFDAGGVTNTATARVGTFVSPPAVLTLKAVLLPALTLVKTSKTTLFKAVDEVIVYDFKVINTGNVTIRDAIGVSDLLVGVDVGCPAPNPTAEGLKPGAFVICQAAYHVTQEDMDRGSITNTAFAVAGSTVSPKVTLVIKGQQKGDFTVAKATLSAPANNNGNGTFTAQFSVTVTNTGNVTLSGMKVKDDYASGLPAGASVIAAKVTDAVAATKALPNTNPGFDAKPSNPELVLGAGETLAPGETMVIKFWVTFDPGLADSGSAFNNVAVASGVLPNGASTGQRVDKNAQAVVTFVANHPLVVTKTTPKSEVIRGELVPYSITVRNDFEPKLNDISIVDLMPAGFKFKPGSATVNGARSEPTVVGRQLTWKNQTVEKGKPVVIKLLLIVGTGVSDAEFTNDAWATSSFGGRISNVGKATVRIVPDPTFDCTDIIGKVFDDANRNGVQDAGERGLANVRVATVRGQLITTDAEGRFHIACADIADMDRGSNFVLKLDERTLPSGYRVTTENPRSIRITRGKMAKLNFGASIHRVARLDLADGAFEAGTVRLNQRRFDALPQMFAALKLERTILRIAYRRAVTDDPALVEQRVRALQAYILSEWKQDGGGYELTIETEIYADQAAQR